MPQPTFPTENVSVWTDPATMSDSDIEAELDEVAVKLSEARTCRGKLGELEARQWRLRSEQTFRQRRPVMTADETSQSEKRRMLAEDRRMRTYHAVAQGSIDDDRGGRFSVMERASVTGSSPVGYPKLPSGPWSEGPGSTEPPLGVDINAMEAVGEPHERGPATVSPSVARTFRRRI